MANASGLNRPTIKTEKVCREFCNMYAIITGSDPRNSSRNSASHRFAREGSSISSVSPSDTEESIDCGLAGLGRRADDSVGGVDIEARKN